MDKQSIIGFVLIGLILMVWLYISAPKTDPVKIKAEKGSSVLVDTNKKAEQNKAKAPDSSVNNNNIASNTIINSVAKDTSKKKPVKIAKPERLIRVENDTAYFVFSSKGARLKQVFLKSYLNWFAENLPKDAKRFDREIQLIPDSASLDFVFSLENGEKISTGDLDFDFDTFLKNYPSTKCTLKGKDSVEIEFRAQINKSTVVKKLKLSGSSYSIQNKVILENFDSLKTKNASLTWKGGINFVEHNSVDEANYSNASVYTGDEQKIVDVGTSAEGIKESGSGSVNWIAVRNKYFTLIVAPDEPTKVSGWSIEGSFKGIKDNGLHENYSTSLDVPIQGNKDFEFSYLQYTGPVKYQELIAFNRKFDKIVDFGSFFGLKAVVRPIAEYLLLPVFQFFHTFIPNYGIIIILFSFVLKFLTYPFTRASMKSMKKMKLLAPQIAALKELHKDDQVKANKETMALYGTYGINPAGGCLPMILQMPIFVAMWGLFQTAVELRQQPFILWIKDLSLPDSVIPLGFTLPLFGISTLSPLALLMGVSMFVQQKMSGTSNDPQQKMIGNMMPIMMTLMFMSFPAGLNLYYFMFNILAIAHQYIYFKSSKDSVLVAVPKHKVKKGFMQRMMESAEKQQSIQKGQKKK